MTSFKDELIKFAVHERDAEYIIDKVGVKTMSALGSAASTEDEFTKGVADQATAAFSKSSCPPIPRRVAMVTAWNASRAMTLQAEVDRVAQLKALAADRLLIAASSDTPKVAAAGDAKKKTYVTMETHKKMIAKWEEKHGRAPAARFMPSKPLLEVVLKAKDEGQFPIISIGDVKTHHEMISEEATKSMSGKVSKKFTFDPLDGCLIEEKEETKLVTSCFTLLDKLAVLFTAFELAELGSVTSWDVHTEELYRIGTRYKGRTYEIIKADAFIRSEIMTTFAINGADMDMAVKEVYEKKAQIIWREEVIEVDPESLNSKKRAREAEAKKVNGKKQATAYGQHVPQTSWSTPQQPKGAKKGSDKFKSNLKFCYAHHTGPEACHFCAAGDCKYSAECPKVGCSETHAMHKAHPELVQELLSMRKSNKGKGKGKTSVQA